MSKLRTITPCLWFASQAEEAAQFYTSIFPHSKITNISYYGEAGYEFHRKPAGTVMAVAFELDGQSFTALNGGPTFTFNEAISFQIDCHTQDEVDHYWEKLSAGGDDRAQQCGWLKDKFGISWQVVPSLLTDLLNDPDTKKSQKVMNAMLQMKKINISELQNAYG